jgi:arginase family enzyme
VEKLRHVFRRLAETGQIAAVSVSTWDPQLDADGRTRQAAMTLLEELLAE